MKLPPLVAPLIPALLLVGGGPLRADDPPEARFAAMSAEKVRAYERETLRRIADLALIPPVMNTAPLPQYDYDKLDYGMTIGIERTPKGRLWACWVAGGDSPKAFFVLATSDDDGETWSKPRLVVDSHSPRLPRDRSILVGNLWTDPLGRLWLIFDQSMEMFDGRGGVWASVCENPDAEKPAWSSPRRIWHGVMLNKPTVLSTGEWMLPVSLDQRNGTHPAERGMFGPFQALFPELDPFRGANVFVSADKGATWQRRGGVAFPNPDWHEHMIVERHDKSLWMLARTTKGIMQSTSTDGGRTWTAPTEPPGIRQPNARFHVRRLASGKLLLVKHGARIDAHEGRVKLSAWLSDDDGATWQGGLVLDERPGISYPDGFQAPDGTIYISYDRNRATDGEILLARFTEADVLAKRLTGPKSKLKMLISRPLAGRTAAASAAAPAADLASLQRPRHVGPPLAEQAATNRAFAGIPSLAVAPGGRLWATWYAGATPAEDQNNYVVLSTSGDAGASWHEVLTVDPDGGTWTGGLMLDERPGVSYPDGQQTPDGLIRIIYDYNRVTDRTILMASFREEDVAAGKDVSGALRLRQLVSKASGGLEKPAASKAAVAANADGKPLRKTLPGTLAGANFLPVAMNGQKTLTVERAGTVFFLTPVLDRNHDTAAQPLMDQGFEKVALPEVPLFHPDSSANFCTLFQKDCTVGETILIGKWAVPVFFP